MNAESRDIDWRQLREFADVDLEGSFVLSWASEAGALMIDVDVLLLPEHPFYEPPRPAEKQCIRPALIEFPFCVAAVLAGAESGSVIPVNRRDIGARLIPLLGLPLDVGGQQQQANKSAPTSCPPRRRHRIA